MLDRLNSTKTRLATDSYLDEDDVGVSYTRTLLVPNKIDVPEAAERLQTAARVLPAGFSRVRDLGPARHRAGGLANAIYGALDVVRVYTKLPTDKEPDHDRPFTVRRGGTLLDMAELVHKDFAQNLKFARVWGSRPRRHRVKGDYVLHDKDVVELHVG